jgi:NTP pyrophosphatase (non-canonical NTP hydrolase)
MSFNNISGVEHARNQEHVHRVNVAKGWYDTPVTFLEAMALLMTEVVEASDAHRTEGLLGGWQAREQLASELADCYIRLADDATRFDIDLGVAVDVYRYSYEPRHARSFDGTCMQLTRRIRDAIEAYRTEGMKENCAGPQVSRYLAYFFLQLQDTCDTHGVDLMSVFSLKMAVNEKREYRHGNKFA